MIWPLEEAVEVTPAAEATIKEATEVEAMVREEACLVVAERSDKANICLMAQRLFLNRHLNLK